MDNLKFIQVQNEDGTLGQKVPIGADATNVTLSSGVNLQTAVININNDIDDLETQMSTKAVATDVTALGDRVTTIQNTIGDASAGQTLTGRISTLQGRADTLQGSVNTLSTSKADKTQVNSTISDLETNIQSLVSTKTDKTYVDTQDNALSARIDSVTDNLDDVINEAITPLESDVNDLKDDVDAINSGMTTYQNTINTQVQDIINNYDNPGSTVLFEAINTATDPDDNKQYYTDSAIGGGYVNSNLTADVSGFDYVEVYSFFGNNNILDIIPVDSHLQTQNIGYAMRWINLPDSTPLSQRIDIIETKISIVGTTLRIVHQTSYQNGSGIAIEVASIQYSNITLADRKAFGILKIAGVKRTGNAAVTDLQRRVTTLQGTTPSLSINANGIVSLN